MKISKWYKFTSKVKRLKTRSINIEIYVRDNPDNLATYRDLDQLALQYKKIPHLHSKLYLNEIIQKIGGKLKETQRNSKKLKETQRTHGSGLGITHCI